MAFKPCKRCSKYFWALRHALRCESCRDAFGRDPDEQAKKSAVRQVRRAIAHGELVRQPCEKCGRSPAHAHHEDYSRPLEVQWLCPLHHKWEHMPRMKAARIERLTAPQPDRDW